MLSVRPPLQQTVVIVHCITLAGDDTMKCIVSPMQQTVMSMRCIALAAEGNYHASNLQHLSLCSRTARRNLISLCSLTHLRIFRMQTFQSHYKHSCLSSCMMRLRLLTVAESAELSLAMTRLVSSLTCFKLLMGSACWAACSSADTNCLSFFTWSNLDKLRPCTRHQLPVIVHMMKVRATAADINCL